ncbi:MAG: hypothetical protein SFV81_02440 [Pirellulaceae bacterium]|nr:hypothetical protein [Pirellulaceae bacterium]
MQYANRVYLSVLFIVLIASSAWACKVPVFRYALERWNADKYQVLVIHNGSLSATSQAMVSRLQSPQLGSGMNLEMQLKPAHEVREKRLLELWKNRTDSSQPLMVVLFPKTAAEIPDRVLLAQPLTEANVDRLLHSPLRKQLAERLSSGQTSVWIFVRSGNEAKDTAALKVLNDRIAANVQRLSVPTAQELEIEPKVLAKNKIPLRIDFSVLELSREDERESFLMNALMKSEVDLDASEPMAFPVFGRGRVLYALVGAGIMPETIDTACQFMAGPCSCQVKNQNPGFDLLIDSDWDTTVAGSIISDALPQEPAEPKLLTIPRGSGKK